MKQSLNTIQNFEEEIIDLHEYWLVIRRHIWGILGFTTMLTILSVIVVFSLDPVYKASTIIMLESQDTNVASIEEIYGFTSKNSDYFFSQIEILKSPLIPEIVVDKLNLVKHPEFDPEQRKTPFISFSPSVFIKNNLPIYSKKTVANLTVDEKNKLIRYAVIERLINQLSIKEHEKSLVVTISYNAKSPKLAAQIANEIANSYIESGYEANLQMIKKAVGWLTERLSGLKEKLAQSEQKLIAYRKAENLLDVQGIQTLSANELEDISDSLLDARRERSKLKFTYYQIQQAKKGGIENYEAISGILNNQAVQHAKDNHHDAQNQIAELSKRYGKKHPKMQSAMANYEKAKNNYLRLLKSVARGIESQYQAAKSNEESLIKDIARSKSKIRAINTKGFKLKELEREVETNRQLYETFFTRFKETSETSSIQTANARVIYPASPPLRPVKPRKNLIIGIVFILSIGFGIILSFLIEALNNTIRSTADVEKKLLLPVLGTIPKQKLKKADSKKPLLAFHHSNKSLFSEAIRTIRTGVILSDLDVKNKIVVITSSIPNEGKTTVSLNLSMALAKTEKVLLIEADMRKPTIAKICDLDGQNGLSTMIAGITDINCSIYTIKKWNLDILTAGPIPPNPQEILTSQRFVKHLELFSKKYERIIIDSAPTQVVSDAYLLSKYANNVIYVIKADSTHTALIKAGIDKLKFNNANIFGVVLNQTDINKTEEYYADYY